VGAVRHSLGFAEDSDARAARILAQPALWAGTALDRRLPNAGAAPGEGQLEGKWAPLPEDECGPQPYRAPRLCCDPKAAGCPHCGRRTTMPSSSGRKRLQQKLYRASAEDACASGRFIERYRLHWIGKALRQCGAIGKSEDLPVGWRDRTFRLQPSHDLVAA
jgi:hypothetical protein